MTMTDRSLTAVVSDLLPDEAPPDAGAGIRRVARRVGQGLGRTEGRLTLLLVALVGLGAAGAAIAVGEVSSRGRLLDDVAGSRYEVVRAAEDLYRSLSDADATVTRALLVHGGEPEDLHQRYRDDIARASEALDTIVDRTPAGDPTRGDAADISAELLEYESVVARARAYNSQAMPLGVTYLRMASWNMRGEQPAPCPRSEVSAEHRPVLDRVCTLYERERGRLAEAQEVSGRLVGPTVAAGVLLLGVLAYGHVFVYRRSRRRINAGLALATVAALAATVWMAGASRLAVEANRASQVTGSDEVAALADARFGGLQVRAYEALALVPGGDDSLWDRVTPLRPAHDLDVAQDRTGEAQTSEVIGWASSTLARWTEAHNALVRNGGGVDEPKNRLAAQASVTGGKDDDLDALARSFDGHIDVATGQARTRFTDGQRHARGALDHVDVIVASLLLVAAAGSAAGLWWRIREYR